MKSITITRQFPNVTGWDGEVWEVNDAIQAFVVQVANGTYRVVVRAYKPSGAPRELFAGAGLSKSQAESFANDINTTIRG